MDTSKHTVTIPIEDYNRMFQFEHYANNSEYVLKSIEKVIRSNKADVYKYRDILHIMNNWIPEHDLYEDDDY